MANVFAIPVFFVTFREALETSIIISVFLSLLKQTVGTSADNLKKQQQSILYNRLQRQVWLGTALGISVCIIIGGALIGVFYAEGADYWSIMEDLYGGIFNVVASLIITVMGVAILRTSKLREKWNRKLAAAFDEKENHGEFSWSRRHFMFVLPFITVLKEGLKAAVFIGGASLSAPAAAFPLSAICGLLAGILVGILLYKDGNKVHLQTLLIASTVLLYIVGAGLFSKGIWDFEMNSYARLIGGDLAETGDGPGSYDIRRSAWYVNYYKPVHNGGNEWGIFSTVLGWQNSATYGSVISYNAYWISVSAAFIFMAVREKKQMKALLQNEIQSDAEKHQNESWLKSKTQQKEITYYESEREGISKI